MFISILKVVAAGILGGILLFAIPFLIFKALFFFLIIGTIFRLMAGRRHYRRWRHHHPYFHHYYANNPYGFPEKEGFHDRFNQNPKQI